MELEVESDSFADRLHWARARKGWTQEALARITGLSKGYLSKLEGDEASPSLNALRKLSQVLEVTAGQLLGTEPIPPPPPCPEIAVAFEAYVSAMSPADRKKLAGYAVTRRVALVVDFMERQWPQHWNREKIALLCGVTPRTLNGVVEDGHEPREFTVRRLSKLTTIPKEFFLTGALSDLLPAKGE